MDNLKLKRVVWSTVKKLSDDYYEDMIRHPESYDYFNSHNEDLCWEEAIEKAKEDVKENPEKWIDEDYQAEMNHQNWLDVFGIADDISWVTFVAMEVQEAFSKGGI